MFPLWIYAAVALVIALLAFAIAQVAPGAGAVFVAGASTLWTAYAVSRQRRLTPRR
ncbi:hypothetical protein [Sphingomonas sp. PB4P5]|uniref:hypothetical protein n=1 Tax=Parasphingomonas puruogangriensis TaxID=3096155 RepID=UPI002FC5D353